MMDEEYTKSPEALFHDSHIEVLIPNATEGSDTLTLLKASLREYAFYDEHLHIYVLVRLPEDKFLSEQSKGSSIVSNLFSQLDVHIEAIMADAGTQQAAIPTGAQYRLTTGRPMSVSTPLSPRIPTNKKESKPVAGGPVENMPYFSHTYNPKGKDRDFLMLFHENTWICLYPLTVPIVYVKTKGQQPTVAVTINISYRPPPPTVNVTNTETSNDTTDDYDWIEDMNTINILAGLADDLSFHSANSTNFPVQRLPADVKNKTTITLQPAMQQPQANVTQVLTLRRSVRHTIAVRSGLNVKMRTNNLSMIEKMLMMSVELENAEESGCSFIVESIDVQVANAVVSKCFDGRQDEFPLRLDVSDQIIFLYNVTLLEDGSSIKPASVTPANPKNISRRSSLQPPQNPTPTTEDRPLVQKVSIILHGAAEVDGVRAPTMISKWNTVLDVNSLRSNNTGNNPPRPPPENVPAPADSRLSALLFSSNTPKSQHSRAQSMTTSPASRSIGPGSPTIAPADLPTAKRRQVMSMPPSFLVRDGVNRARRAQDMEVVDGITVSFAVTTTVKVGHIFPLQIFIINRSKHTRRFMVTIPNRKRSTLAETAMHGELTGEGEIEPFMEETEFLRRYFDTETHEAGIVCLENNVRFSPLNPFTCQTVDIPFIACKAQLHTIDLIQLVDADTGFVINCNNVIELFVES